MPTHSRGPTFSTTANVNQTPRQATLIKLVSLDGLVGWDNRVYPEHQDVIRRHVLLPLRPATETTNPRASTATYWREYQYSGTHFDNERGIFVSEYKEI